MEDVHLLQCVCLSGRIRYLNNMKFIVLGSNIKNLINTKPNLEQSFEMNADTLKQHLEMNADVSAYFFLRALRWVDMLEFVSTYSIKL